MSRNGGISKHATLLDFRDLDLLLKIEHEANDDGWLSTEDAARSLGFDDEQRPLGIRFAWMRRYGMLEFDQQKKLWRLTDGAHRVTESRLRAAASRTIEELPDEQMIDVMSKVTQRYMHGDPMIATLLRREFRFGTQPR